MAEIVTIARPYAEAVYRIAAEQERLDSWSRTLAALALMATTPDMVSVLTDPSVSASQLEELIWGVLGDYADGDVKRFVVTLVENHRLLALPEIACQFERLKTNAEGRVEARVETAFPLTAEQRADLIKVLSEKYHKTVQLDVSENPELIGGVRIFVGDNVIDASVRGKLHAMAVSLKN